MTASVGRRLFNVHEYYCMAEAGILGRDERVELIEGEIIEMPPIGSHHASVVDRLNSLFVRATDDQRALVRVQNPISLDDFSEPQPDICLLRPRPDFYAASHPAAADVLLLIEVSLSSLAYDRGRKLPIYARAGVAEVWIVDLEDDQLEIYRQPTAAGYQETRILARGANVAPSLIPSLTVAVDAVLGPVV